MLADDPIEKIFLWINSISFAVIILVFCIGFSGFWYFFLIMPLVVGPYLFFSLRKRNRRLKIVSQPFPELWRRFLIEDNPFYRALDSDGKTLFEQNMALFLNEFSIEGVRRRLVDEKTKLRVAAAIVTMLHGRPEWEPPITDGVIIYPGDRMNRKFQIGKGNYAGMATYHGPLILTEGGLEESFRNPHDGYHAVYHEMAHYFDLEDAQADGIPGERLSNPDKVRWREIIGMEWRKAASGNSFLREYAAQNEVEFFAVAVEAFYEIPWELKANAPELYHLFRVFFNCDTAELLKP